ncbi:hypothetical protein [Nocardia nepalensis]|uniref:hypothetical protein n=1 Tax=Nocardia nepalensis TaxID=3375448 RepID=UPI003B67837D
MHDVVAGVQRPRFDYRAVRDSNPAACPAGIPRHMWPVGWPEGGRNIGADSPQSLVFLLAAIDADFEIEDGEELAAHLRRITLRFQSALD